MLLACIKLQRVCAQRRAEGEKDTAGFCVSLLAPSGVEVNSRTALRRRDETGRKDVAVCCAVDADLQDVFFAVRRTPAAHVHVGGDEDVTLRCRLWHVAKEGRDGDEKSGDSSQGELSSSASSKSCGSDAAVSAWQLLAEGTVRATRYGPQTVELVPHDAAAKEIVGDSISILIFVLPRLRCTVEEEAMVPVAEENSAALPARLEAHESCDFVPALRAFSAASGTSGGDDVLEPTVKSDVSFGDAVGAPAPVDVDDEGDNSDVGDGGDTSSNQENVAGVGRQEKNGEISSPSPRRDGMATARWMLFVEMAPWQKGVPIGMNHTETSSPLYMKDHVVTEAEGFWRLTLCGADGCVLARGSSFCGSVCYKSGWSDAMVALSDAIVADAVVSLQLQRLTPVEPSDDDDDMNRNDAASSIALKRVLPGINRPARWTSVAMSVLLPVADLLASSRDARMLPISLFAVGAGDVDVAPRIPFTREGRLVTASAMLSQAPTRAGALDGADWMTAQHCAAAHFYKEVTSTHTCRLPQKGQASRQSEVLCSVVLHVSSAVFFRLGAHVDTGAVYPLVALTISGGCELLLEATNDPDDDDGDGDELRRAPVMRFDARVHTTVDEAHSVLLLTLHSPVTPEVVFGRAVFSPFELSLLPTGRVWLPLHNDKTATNSTAENDNSDDYGHGNNEGEFDSSIAGWIHCSYECVFVLEERRTLGVSATSSELLRPSLVVPAPLLPSRYLAAPSVVAASRCNRLRLCVVEAVNVHMGSSCADAHKRKCGLYASVHVVPPPTCVSCVGALEPSSSSFTTPVIVSVSLRWRCFGTLAIAADTTHLVIQVSGGHSGTQEETEYPGVVDIPRVVISRFWTTPVGEAWIPIVAPRQGTSRYRGALFLRWSFESHVNSQSKTLRGADGSPCPGRLPFPQLQPRSVHWVRLGNMELVWPWLLHQTAWKFVFALSLKEGAKVFLRIAVGHFLCELALRPLSSATGHRFFVDETAYLPLTDRFDVAVCYYCNHNFPFSYLPIPYFSAEEIVTTDVAALGVGELLLSTDDRTELLVCPEREHRMEIRIEPPAMVSRYRVQPGVLTANLVVARIAQQHRGRYLDKNEGHRPTRWAWASPECSTVVELRLGRVFVRSAQSIPLLSSSTTLASSRWIVSARQKVVNENNSNTHTAPDTLHTVTVSPSVILKTTAASAVTPREDGDALYLSCPALPSVDSLHQRPLPPTVELLFSPAEADAPIGNVSMTPEWVGSVALDLAHCFEGSKGTGLFPLRLPFASCEGTAHDDESNVIGLVELHYAHNLTEEDDRSSEVENPEQEDETGGRENLFMMTVVRARYRQWGWLSSSPKNEGPATFFVVGLENMSCRTATQVGMAPHFDCQMVFAPPYAAGVKSGKMVDEVLHVRLQMLLGETPNNSDPCGETVSQPSAAAFVFLHLERCAFAPVGEMNFGQWFPLYTTDAEMGGVCVFVGEVLLRWGWFSHSLWDRLTSLSVSTAPPPLVSATEHSNAMPTMPLVKNRKSSEKELPPFLLHLSLYIHDFVAFDHSFFDAAGESEVGDFFVTVHMEETLPLEGPSFLSFLLPQERQQQQQRFGGLGAKYGDRTGTAVFNSASKCCVWMEHCFLPVIADKEMSLCFELRRSRGVGSDGAHRIHGGDVLASGRLKDCEIIWGGGANAIAIFSSGEARLCGSLKVAVALSPLCRDPATVSRRGRGLQEEATDSLGAVERREGQEGADDKRGVQSPNAATIMEASRLTLLRCVVHKVKTYDENALQGARCWEWTLRSEAVLGDRAVSQWTRLDARPTLDGRGEEWEGVVCAQNMSKMEVWLRRVVTGNLGTSSSKVEKAYGHFVVSCVPRANGVLENTFRVDLSRYISPATRGDVDAPVGSLRISCRPLVYSGVLYDPYSVFLRRTLRLTVTELLGVVRTVRRRSYCRPYLSQYHWSRERKTTNNGVDVACMENWDEGKKHVLCGKQSEGALLYMQLQCEAETAVSSLFAPPLVEMKRGRKSQIGKTNNGNINDIISHDDALHFSLLLDCCPVESGGGAEVRLSLHFSPMSSKSRKEGDVHESSGDLLIGEAVAHVPPSDRVEGLNSRVTTTTLKGGGTGCWVPISTVDTDPTGGTAYAHLRHAWSHQVVLGTWLVCARLRLAKRPSTLHCPFLRFVVRFPSGEMFWLPVDLLGTALSEPPADCSFAPLQSVWSFAHIQLPVIWPLGARVECVELHDRVSAGMTVHLGTHQWTASDTALFISFGNEKEEEQQKEQSTAGQFASPSSFCERWLRFRRVGGDRAEENEGEEGAMSCGHELLIARSLPPPAGVETAKDLHVPFLWSPVKVVLHLAASGLDVALLEAGQLVVSCTAHIGRWRSTASARTAAVTGWAWENYNEADELLGNTGADAIFASHIVVEPSDATVTATWGTTSFFNTALTDDNCGVFRRYISVHELRDVLVRYALCVKIVCRTRRALPSLSESSTETAISTANSIVCTREAIFVLNDCCMGTRGETLLSLTESVGATAAVSTTKPHESTGCGSLTMTWAIAHDQMTSLAPEQAAPCAVALSRLLQDSGEKEEGSWRHRDAEDGVPQKEEPMMPSWLLTSIEARDLQVVLDEFSTATTMSASSAHVEPSIPVLAHLVAQRRQRRGGSFSSCESKKQNSRGGFSLISVNATPGSKIRRRLLYALQMEPMWCIKPRQWMDQRRSLHLTLWQVLSGGAGVRHTLGTLRLDAILREAFTELSIEGKDGSGNDIPAEVVTEWKSLFQGELMEQNMGSVRFRLRPLMDLSTERSLSDHQMHVCVEVKEVTAHSFGGTAQLHNGGGLALVFCPAGNFRFMSCSTTRLQNGADAKFSAGAGGSEEHDARSAGLSASIRDGSEGCIAGAGGVISHSLVALSTLHSFLLDGQRLDVDAGSDAWPGIDVLLVECRKDDEGEVHSGVGVLARGDVLRVLSMDQLDLRSLWSLSVLRENTEGENQSPVHGAADFTVTFCFRSNVVIACLHVVALELSGPPGEAQDESKDVSLTPGSKFSHFFCSADGCGEDNAGSGTFGDVLCAVGGKVYKIVETNVYEWDARELQRVYSSSSSSGAVAFTVPRLNCFKWKRVDTKLEMEPHFAASLWRSKCRRVGHAVWAYDEKYIMMDRGLSLQHTVGTGRPSPRPPPAGGERRRGLRQKRYSSEISANKISGHTETPLLQDTSSTLPCYDIDRHRWGVVRTEIGNPETMPYSRVFHSAVVIHEKVWCFGGFHLANNLQHDGAEDASRGPEAATTLLSNTLTCLDLPTRQWRTVEPMAQLTSRAKCPDCTAAPFAAVKTPLESSPPPPVACHTAVGWNGQMFVFGGLREETPGGAELVPTDDLYAFHVSRLAWCSLSPQSVAATFSDGGDGGGGGGSRGEQGAETGGGCRRHWPCARYGHAAAVVPEHPHGAFLVFGGATRFSAGGAAAGATVLCALDELLWVYYAALGRWQNVRVPSSVPLAPRVFPSVRVVRLTGEPWASYAAVVAGGCGALWMAPGGEEKLSQGTAGAEFADGAGVGGLALGEAAKFIISAALRAPWMGTVWVSLEERV